MSAANTGLKAAQDMATKALKSPWPWVIIALILGLAVYRNGRRWIQQLTRVDRGNYAGQEAVGSNPVREGELQKMAQEAYQVIHGTLVFGGITWTGRTYILERLLQLNDTELRYVAEFYASSVNPGGESLRQDITDEWGLGQVGTQLEAKLAQLAL